MIENVFQTYVLSLNSLQWDLQLLIYIALLLALLKKKYIK